MKTLSPVVMAELDDLPERDAADYQAILCPPAEDAMAHTKNRREVSSPHFSEDNVSGISPDAISPLRDHPVLSALVLTGSYLVGVVCNFGEAVSSYGRKRSH